MTNAALITEIQKPFLKESIPQVRTGMEVEIHQSIKDGEKTRIQKFRGLVIHTRGKTALEKAVVVRKDVDGIGVEKIFVLHSPTVVKIEVLRSFKVRRKNIAFIRTLTGKAARLREVQKK